MSGVDVAPVPLPNYAVDINIPSGLDASAGDDLFTVVQDLLVTPVWTAVVWLVHVVLIALEWCYAIDLLGPQTLTRVSSSLGAAQRIFTNPWIGLALAVAAAAFAWQGLVRRRVMDTLGQAALVAIMICAGLWIIADPAGTVGAVGNLADRAALATVAASATGDPSQPVASVDGAFAQVFDATINGPWCYLEFGDVDWCRQDVELDPSLRATAAGVAQELRAEATCSGRAPGLVRCAPGGSALQSELAGAATALTAARTNGALFLALPPEALARTALSDQTATPTLYGTLCGSGDPTACTAPTAPQAQFRTASGTWPRVGGLLLIVAGTLGMLLLFGFLALRLLGAALATLLYLMLAPLAVLAPALGEAGRSVFRLWITRLVGAALAKLVYSVALGAVLLVESLLSSLDGLGWWTQWLLVSVFWWMAFEHRHRLLGLVIHERDEPMRRAPLATRVWLAGRAARAGLGVAAVPARFARSATARATETINRYRDFPPDSGRPSPPAPTAPRGGGGAGAPRQGASDRPANAGPRAARREPGAQLARLRDGARADRANGGPAADDERLRAQTTGSLEGRRQRIQESLVSARRDGDRRRVVSLEQRAARIDAALSTRGDGALRARGATIAGPTTAAWRERLPAAVARAVGPSLTGRARWGSAARALERPALAPRGFLARQRSELAAPLAPRAGIAPSDYLRRSAGEQRAGAIEIERQLERRRELSGEAGLWRGRAQAPRIAPAPSGAEQTGSATPPTLARRARQFGPRES